MFLLLFLCFCFVADSHVAQVTLGTHFVMKHDPKFVILLQKFQIYTTIPDFMRC